MVSSTLCPAVHILGSQNVYGRAEGIADHYWPWAVFFFLSLFPSDGVSRRRVAHIPAIKKRLSEESIRANRRSVIRTRRSEWPRQRLH